MDETDQVKVYQLRVYLRQISPMIWRRLLVRSDSTIADLHYTLQIAMGWDDFHLHQFIIRDRREHLNRKLRFKLSVHNTFDLQIYDYAFFHNDQIVSPSYLCNQ